MKKILFGVMGNMGPEADALFQDIVAKKEIEHGALKDQDHMGMLVVKNLIFQTAQKQLMRAGRTQYLKW